MRQATFGLAAMAMMLLTSTAALAHCEVPCGIYDDEARFQMLSEHILTIEKAMGQIVTLSADDKPNYNQIVRWVATKEKHAEAFQEIVSQYFLIQKIKPVSGEDKAQAAHYLGLLEDAHNLLVLAMKAKQSTDMTVVGQLREQLAAFKAHYSAHTH